MNQGRQIIVPEYENYFRDRCQRQMIIRNIQISKIQTTGFIVTGGKMNSSFTDRLNVSPFTILKAFDMTRDTWITQLKFTTG